MNTIDLNVDLGESAESVRTGRDAALASLATSINIACGGHAGDEGTMRAMLAVVRRGGGSPRAGAHPGYPDPDRFGRVTMTMSADDLRHTVRRQIAALRALAEEAGVTLSHVKPHGALYHDADEPAVAEAIRLAIDDAAPGLPVMLRSGSKAASHFAAAGEAVIAEAFADRLYLPDGRLAPRTAPGSVIEDPARAAEQAVLIATRGHALSAEGARVPLSAGTICVHGDTPGALDVLRAVREGLERAGVTPAAPSPRSPR
jgi:UPF0271 protein